MINHHDERIKMIDRAERWRKKAYEFMWGKPKVFAFLLVINFVWWLVASLCLINELAKVW